MTALELIDKIEAEWIAEGITPATEREMVGALAEVSAEELTALAAALRVLDEALGGEG